MALKAELLILQDYLNTVIPRIQVTFTVRESLIKFLDTTVYFSIDPVDYTRSILDTQV